MQKVLFSILAILLLSGCATQYEKATWWRDGYTNYQIAEDTYSVTFQGNRYTSKEQTERFAMLRAAELTQRAGYTHFIIVDERDRSEVTMERYDRYHTPSKEDGLLVAICEVLAPSPNSRAEAVTRPRITLRIQCLKNGSCAGAICAQEYLRYNLPD